MASKDLLSNIQEELSSKQTVDPKIVNAEASEADQDADKAIKLELIRAKREQIKQLEQNREERKKYAGHIFKFTCAWAAIIFVILILSGWNKAWSRFETSDKVLITLITSTTVNFFGFFLLVVKYLFHTGEIEKEEKKGKKKKAAVIKKGKPKKEEGDEE